MKTRKNTLLKSSAAILFTAALLLAPSAYAVDASIQAMGGWWEAGDSGDTYGYGLRGSVGANGLAVDLGWMHYGEGDDIDIDALDYHKDLGGIKSNVFDLGMRYTLPMELYFGGGLSYYDFDHDVESIDGEWGVYGLVGWSFGGEHIRGFIEGMYRYTEGTVSYDDEFEGHFDRDVDHDGLGANIGIMYRF